MFDRQRFRRLLLGALLPAGLAAVTGIAVTGIAVAGVAGVGSAATTAATATVTVKPGTGAKLTDDFIGLSFEVNLITQPALTSGNLAQYLKTLGPGVLRFGGNQVDKAYWTSRGEPAPSWAATTLTPADLDRLKTLATASGWKVILGVNLAHPDPNRAADEAGYAKRALGDSLIAIEVGNEPNYYSGNTPARYYTNFENYRKAIAKTAPGLGLLGPSGGSADAAVTYFQDFARRQLANPNRNLESLSTHYYPACARSTPTPTMANLLSATYHDRIRTRVQALVDAAKPLGVKTRLTEANSLTCGGVEGVSDRYGSALWAVDQELLVASLGVAGENFHGNIALCGGPKPPGAAYTPFCAATTADAAAGKLIPQPEYYALRMLQEVGTGNFAPVDSTDTANLRSYAVKRGGRLRLVLDNLGASRTVTVNLGGAYAQGDLIRLTGPGLTATTGITLGGGTVRHDGTFSGATHTPVTVSGSTLTLTLPATSATLVTLTP
jgi:Glycosyl hydrolase family 79 C-terminal beta domain